MVSCPGLGLRRGSDRKFTAELRPQNFFPLLVEILEPSELKTNPLGKGLV